MEVKYNNRIGHKIVSPFGDQGVITDLGINRSNVPSYFISFKDMDLKDAWFPAAKCNSAPGTKATGCSVKYKFDIKDKVVTEFSEGIITWAAKGIDDEISYVVDNAVQGVENTWWPEAEITIVSPPIDINKPDV